MPVTSLFPLGYSSIPTRRAGSAGELPRQYLLDYVVGDMGEYLQIIPAGSCTYAVAIKPRHTSQFDLTLADLSAIPGAKVIACLPHVATLFIPLAQSTKEVAEEVACAFAALQAEIYNIKGNLDKYEAEMAYEIQADYHLDEAA